jgi:hypothetical protein
MTGVEGTLKTELGGVMIRLPDTFFKETELSTIGSQLSATVPL